MVTHREVGMTFQREGPWRHSI